MTACNARPPAGHPLHDWGVACHLDADHDAVGAPHSWDLDAIAANHAILARALEQLRAMHPGQPIEQFDVQPPHALLVYAVDEHGNRADRPYRSWDTIAGPWVVVTFAGGEEYAIWKVTGAVYRVGPDGAVDEDPIIGP